MNSGIRIIFATLELLGLSFQVEAPLLGQHSHQDAQGTYVHFHDGIFSELLESSNPHSHHGEEHFHLQNHHPVEESQFKNPGSSDGLFQRQSASTFWSLETEDLAQSGLIVLRDYWLILSQKLAPAIVAPVIASVSLDLSSGTMLAFENLPDLIHEPYRQGAFHQSFAHRLPPDIVVGLIPFRTPPPC